MSLAETFEELSFENEIEESSFKDLFDMFEKDISFARESFSWMRNQIEEILPPNEILPLMM